MIIFADRGSIAKALAKLVVCYIMIQAGAAIVKSSDRCRINFVGDEIDVAVSKEKSRRPDEDWQTRRLH